MIYFFIVFKGSQFLSNYGTLTSALKPPLKGVPTIVFNNAYKQEDSDLAQKNFAKALCQYISTDKPEECNSAINFKLSIAALLLAFAVFLNNNY